MSAGIEAPCAGSLAPGARVLHVAIDVEPRRGVENMAIDEALLARVEASGEEAWLRLYGWAVPTLSLGFAQPLSRGVDLEYCRRHGVDVVRRMTGGRAVLHDKEHTYAVAVPYAWLPGPGDLGACHGLVSQVLVEALVALGVDAVRGCGSARGQARQTCFASVSRDEITANGRKLVGSAQRRGRSGFLQHGSILIDADVSRHLAATGEQGEGPSGWIGLGELLACPPSRERLGSAMVEPLAAALRATAAAGDLAALSAGLAASVARHASAEWISRIP